MPEVASFLNPRTVAVVGVSHDKEKVGRIIYSQLLEKKKKVWGINPQIKTLDGKRIYSSISEIKNCDLVVYAIPADAVLVEIEKAAQKGFKNHLIISAGFAETGKIGLERTQKLQEIINKYNIFVQGPNCLGNISPVNNFNISFGNFASQGNIGVISQSGAIGTALLDWTKKERFGISHFVSLGNKVNLTENDFLSYLSKDPQTKIIGLYLENVSYGRKLLEIAKNVNKPIVILKAGQTEEAKIAVSSHTGVLAGSFVAQRAAFNQANIIEADNLEQFFNLLKILSLEFSILTFHNIVILTNAGGPAVLAVDFLTSNKLQLAQLDESVRVALKTVLPPSSSVNNPIDLLGDADVERFTKVFKVFFSKKDKLLFFIILTPQENTDLKGIAKILAEYKSKYKNLLIVNIIGGERREEPLTYLAQQQIPAFTFFEDAIICLSKIKNYQDNIINNKRFQPKSIKISVSPIQVNSLKKILPLTKGFLPEEIVLKIARSYKLPIIETVLCKNWSQAEKFAHKNGFPLVLKVSDPKIIHRNKEGGVFLDIKSLKELEIKFDVLQRVTDKIVIQKMIEPEAEIIVGAKKDADFGHLLMFGSGGIHTEYLKDVNFAVLPLNYKNMIDLIDKTKVASLISDKKVFWPIFSSLSKLLADFPEIEEIDLNPVVLSHGKLYCVDIKIKV